MWKTIFRLPKDLIDEVELICRDIRDKDKSFKFRLVGNILMIFSETEKKAYARGYWFKQKVDDRLSFKVTR